MRRGAAIAAALILMPLAGCDRLPFGWGGDRPGTAADFPSANRPVAPVNSPRWTDEDTRDRLGEADDVMDRAGIASGMTVADIGAGEGYYTVRLSQRVGDHGRVLAQDIVPDVVERLGVRVNRERLGNVAIKLGAADDPRLPANSFDRVLIVHMYHEIAEPYAFLWRLWPALRGDGQVIVVDANRPIAQHGTPLPLLICEFQAVGYRPLEFVEKPNAGGYFARFVRARTRPAPPRATSASATARPPAANPPRSRPPITPAQAAPDRCPARSSLRKHSLRGSPPARAGEKHKRSHRLYKHL